MKKILVLAVVLLLLAPISAMAGMSAFMNMDEMSGNEMSDVTGQTGITIDLTQEITGGYVAWGDNDGCTTYTTAGFLILSTITAGPITVDGLTIDACYDGTTAYLVIGVPSTIINANIAAIRLADSAGFGLGDSLGSLTIGSLAVTGMTVRINGH
ncbi:MAG: hypothetical protein KKA60_06750 [Proteobacteria bacterium]|nr:hypothetical protein [Pseudomonadota bacterium]